jgi:hypothetical protein
VSETSNYNLTQYNISDYAACDILNARNQKIDRLLSTMMTIEDADKTIAELNKQLNKINGEVI